MTTYRYYTQDLLTREILGELPLYGVACDRQLNASGQFTGTFRLGTHIHADDVLMSSSTPRKTAIYMQRDGITIWGGIIWSRTFGSKANTIQLSAQTFESFFQVFVLLNGFERLAYNQMQAMVDMIDEMQTDPFSDIGVDTSFVDVSGGNLKDVSVAPHDYKFMFDPMDELASSIDGFDWTINVVDSGTPDSPLRILQIGQPILTTEDTVASYAYPGNIDEFYWPESGGKSGTVFIALGAGTGSEMLVAIAPWQDAIPRGYPTIHKIVSWKHVSDQNTLNSIAQGTAAILGPDVTNPTISIVSDRDPGFNDWNNLGAKVLVDLSGPRFPGGFEFTRRMIGWELSAAQAGQNEMVKLRLEEGDDSEG